MICAPNYHSGFARTWREVAPLVQAIRRSCVAIWAPMLGTTGGTIPNIVCPGVGAGTPTGGTWDIDYLTMSGSSSGIDITASGVPSGFPTSLPMSFIAWATTDDDTKQQVMVNYHDGSNRLCLGIHATVGWVACDYSRSLRTAFPYDTTQNDTWYLFAGAFSTTKAQIYILGQAPSVTDSGIYVVDGFQVAKRTGAYYWDGKIRYVAVMNRWLEKSEFLTLEADPAALLRRCNRGRKLVSFATASAPPTGNRRRRVLICGAA